MRYVYLGIAWTMVGLGMVGVVLPGLPFTPFILAAGFFGAKGSPGFEARLTSSHWYQKHVASTMSQGEMSSRQKLKILLIATTMLLIAIAISSNVLLRWVLVGVMVLKYSVFLFVIPTKKEAHHD